MASETFGIPRERAAQLRTLAKHLDIPIGDLVERWITAELTVSGLDDSIPGFCITFEPGITKLVLTADELPILPLELTEARRVADSLAAVADRGGVVSITTEDARDRIDVSRLGRAVVIAVQGGMLDGEGRRTLTAGVARDLARQLRRAADEAEA